MARNERHSALKIIMFGFAMVVITLGGLVLFVANTVMKLEQSSDKVMAALEEKIRQDEAVISKVGEIETILRVSEDTGLKFFQADAENAIHMDTLHLVEGKDGAVFYWAHFASKSGEWELKESGVTEGEALSAGEKMSAGHNAHNRRHYDVSERMWKEAYEAGERNRGMTAFNIGCALSLQGKEEEAIDWLEQAVDEGWVFYHSYENDSDLDNLRDNERFQKILENLSDDPLPPVPPISPDDEETSPNLARS